MIAAFIFLLSLLALLQFFITYSRSVIALSRAHEISDETLELCGFVSGALAGDRFPRLSKLIALCAETGEDGHQVRAVSAYFRLLEFARRLLWWEAPSAAPWIELERDGCARAAALFLDRRIARNRWMLAQESVAPY